MAHSGTAAHAVRCLSAGPDTVHPWPGRVADPQLSYIHLWQNCWTAYDAEALSYMLITNAARFAAEPPGICSLRFSCRYPDCSRHASRGPSSKSKAAVSPAAVEPCWPVAIPNFAGVVCGLVDHICMEHQEHHMVGIGILRVILAIGVPKPKAIGPNSHL